MKVLLNITN